MKIIRFGFYISSTFFKTANLYNSCQKLHLASIMRNHRIKLVICLYLAVISNIQKQPSRGVLIKRYAENMQKIYRRTPMPKCNFNNVLHFY